MWILAYFTQDGQPATGLSPLVRIRDVETGGIVISSASMVEKGDGFYGYDFSGYNPAMDYAIICDGVTLSGVERYTYASSGEYNEVLDTIESTVGIVDIRTVLLRKIQTNRLELFDGDTDNWVLYDDDDATALLTFSVTDKDGNLIIQQPNTPSKRWVGWGTVSGAISPEIFMRKSVYDADEDGIVSSAENVTDGVYMSTASGVRLAVDNYHLPCILGTKCIDESVIGDQLVIKYDAATDSLVYGLPNVSGSASGTISHSWLMDLDGDDHTIYTLADGTRPFTSTVVGIDPTQPSHLATKNYIDNQIAVLSGATDEHSELQGLDADDHSQYHTDTRGDIRYYTKAEVDELIGTNKSGKEALSNGDTETSVNFATPFTSDVYSLFVSLENTTDSPSSEYAITITDKTDASFTINYSGEIDSNNYYLNWYATTSGVYGGDYISEVVNDTSPQLGGDLELGNYSIILNTTPPTQSGVTGQANGEMSTMVVDWNDTGVGCPLFMATDGHWEQALAASGTGRMPCSSMAIDSGTGSKRILWKGIIRKEAWSWTPGDVLYISTVGDGGSLTNAAPSSGGDWVQPIGVAITSNIIRFDPGFNTGEINS